MLRLKKKKEGFMEKAVARIFQVNVRSKEEGLEFLVQFFNDIRPGGVAGNKHAEQNLRRAIKLLHQYPLLLTNLQQAFLSQLVNTDLTSSLTESGIPLARGFWQEFSDRLKHKLLPPLQDPNDFLYVISRVFFSKNDIVWIESISRETWIQFFEKAGLPFAVENRKLQQQLMNALKILSFQIAQLGLEKEVVRYLPAEMRENPFVEQSYLLRKAGEWMLSQSPPDQLSVLAESINQQLSLCGKAIDHIRVHQSEKGTGLRQTYILLILSGRLQRMRLMVDILDRDHHFETEQLYNFFIALVRNENRKNSIREFLSQSLGYLAYRIAEHKGSKGDKYITTTRSEYWKMILSAMWGGFIISFIAVFKNLLSKLALAPFWQGFVYSINYSAGFIAIDQTKSTLATKQPAFTASAVASSLDTRKSNSQPNLYNLAVTVAKVSRSQIASFLGNLLIVFPLTFFLSWLYFQLTGSPIAGDEAAWQMLKDQHPWQSFALLYACFTGVFLFISGIIAGYMQNKIQYAHIPERLQQHPWLRFSFSGKQLKEMASFIEKNAGSIAGNIALGFFLGMAGTFGKIFGLPFDIRHITIAAGNSAIAVEEIGFMNIPPRYLLTVFLGVLAIGFLNFLVSFSLAFAVAVKSRGIHLREYPEFLKILWRYFLNNPMDFIRPRKRLESE